jgi:hypothetical protein
VSPGDRFRHNHDGQVFEVRSIRKSGAAMEVTLDPVTPPVRQADTRYRGEVFPLAGIGPEDLIEPTWSRER